MWIKVTRNKNRGSTPHNVIYYQLSRINEILVDPDGSRWINGDEILEQYDVAIVDEAEVLEALRVEIPKGLRM